jgi:hypothetical protein
MTDILNAILAINPKAEVTVEDENWDTIIWHNIEPLEKSVVLAKKVELETAYNDNAYQRSRKVEYPSIVDQLDDLYHNGIDGWKTTIKTIKDKYPKG